MKTLGLEFVTGRHIAGISLELGEDARSSSVQVDLEFDDLSVASKLIQESFAKGGIAIPNDLLAAAQTAVATGAGTASGDGGGGSGAGTAVGNGEGIAGTTSTGIPLSAAPEGTRDDELAKYIVQYCNAVGVTDKSHQAYILATCQHESVMGLYTAEIGGESTRYAPWYGRGLVQLKANEPLCRNA